MSGRVVRIFLSSTFRDFGEERDLLVRQLFPTLRARLQSRFVDLIDVDLRWGITAEEAERGDVLPICLSEIDRARPFFIGFLEEYYSLCDYFAVDCSKRVQHSALIDIELTTKVFQVMLKKGYINYGV